VTDYVLKDLGARAKNQTVINVNENDTVMSDEQTLVHLALAKTDVEKVICEVFVPIITRLLQPLHILAQA
jgi:hypothetical protein